MDLRRDDAVAITRKFLDLCGRVDQSVAELMRSGCSGAQLQEYRRLAGRIMGNVFLHVLKPIFEIYPDLEPTEPATSGPALDRDVAVDLLRLVNDTSTQMIHVHQEYRDQFGEQLDEGVKEVDQAVTEVRGFIYRSHPDLRRDR